MSAEIKIFQHMLKVEFTIEKVSRKQKEGRKKENKWMSITQIVKMSNCVGAPVPYMVNGW